MADRPAFPGTIPFGSKVIVEGGYDQADFYGEVVGSRSGIDGRAVLLIDTGKGYRWYDRRRVTLAPPPWPVRAWAAVKSFVVGEP